MSSLKFLADVNLEESFSDLLKNSGYNVKKVSEINCFMSDKRIINLGSKEKRIIVTEDKDFGEKIYKDRIHCYGMILIRVNSKLIISREKKT